VPLVIQTAPANANDYKLILPVVEDFPEIGCKPGRPRKHPDVIYADRGYDSEAVMACLGNPDPVGMKVYCPTGKETFDDETTEEAPPR